MLGILLIYFIGKSFYKLAEEYNKHKWGVAIIGVIAYYVGTFISGIAIALFYELILSENVDNLNDLVLSFMSIPFGLLACWGLNTLLKKQWKSKRSRTVSMETLDGEFLKE